MEEKPPQAADRSRTVGPSASDSERVGGVKSSAGGGAFFFFSFGFFFLNEDAESSQKRGLTRAAAGTFMSSTGQIKRSCQRK